MTTLMKYIDAETTQTGLRYREIDLELSCERLKQIFTHQLDSRLPDHFGRHFEFVDRHDLAVDLDLGWSKWREEKVRCLFLDHQLEKWFYIHLLCSALSQSE